MVLLNKVRTNFAGVDNVESSAGLLRNIMSGYNVRAFLVGGYLRDLLLGREPFDLDLVVSDRVEEIACAWARETGGSPVELDGKRGTYRVVTSGREVFDFSLLRGGDIREDLGCRDFTINALAYPLAELPVVEEKIIDPLGGRVDLENRVIRAVSEQAFIGDPLRVLRAVRLMVQLGNYGFRIAGETGNYIRKYRDKLASVARERIREELVKCFRSLDEASQVLYIEKESGLFSFFMSELVEDRRELISGITGLGVLFSLLPEGRRSDYLLKLATLLYPLLRDEQDCGAWFSGLRFSRREISSLEGILSGGTEMLRLYGGRPGEQEVYRVVREIGDNLSPAGFLAAAVHLAQYIYLPFPRYREERDRFFAFLERLKGVALQLKEAQAKVPGGEWVMDVLSLPEGPEVGRVLSDLEIEIARGRIESERMMKMYLLEKYR